MLVKLLLWIMTKKPRPECTKARGRCIAGFLVIMMVVVTSLMGMQSSMQMGKWDRDSGRSSKTSVPALAGHYYASFDIHR